MTPSAIAEYAEKIGAHHSLYEKGWADVHTFVESLGGRLEMGGSGESLVVDGDHFTVYVPLSTSWLRDRLIISRALGHLFLHYLVPQAVSGAPFQRTFSHGLTGQREAEAGVFASALLMPMDRFVDVYWQSGEDLALVAKAFRVPWESARSRGFALGLPVGVHKVEVAS